ncbi:hypothetical protein DMENIID0001_085140 [Sergentomyia squamirostris]
MDLEFSVDVNNHFDVLGTGDGADHEKLLSKQGAIPKKKNGKSDNAKKIAPLIVTSISRESICSLLNKLKIHQYSVNFMSIGIKLQLTQPEHFDAVKAAFQQENIQFFYYQLTEDKLAKFVLRGLYNMSVDTLKSFLNEKNLCPVDIKPMNLKKLWYQDHMNYIVFFKKEISLADVKKVDSIDHIIVNWDFFRKNESEVKQVLQCSNCNLFGHMHRFCHRNVSCAICGDHHNTNSCPNTRNEDAVKCCNCGGKHDARFEACPKRAEYLTIRLKNQNNAPSSTNRQRQSSRFTTSLPDVSSTRDYPSLPPSRPVRTPAQDHLLEYQQRLRDGRLAADEATQAAQITPPVPSQQVRPEPGRQTQFASLLSQNNPPIVESTAKVNSNLFSYDEMMNLISELLESLSRCTSKRDQFNVITTLTVKFLYNYHDD